MDDVVSPSNVWAGTRVFVTGHTGFKGSWLSLWLQEAGAHVTGYALPAPTRPSLFELGGVAKGMRSIIGDIRDSAQLLAGIREAQPEVVLHMAAQSLVRESYRDPVTTYETNVMGTVHLLEAVRQVDSVRAVVVVSSDKCYENRDWPWGYRETDPMGGFDPYSSSKGCTELVTAAYRRSYFGRQAGAPARVLLGSGRAGNVIGGGDWADDRLVPDVIRAFGAGTPVAIRHPHAIRPWQHVLEPLHGYLLLAARLYGGDESVADGWNFGASDDDTHPVSWIVDELARRWGDGASSTIDDRTHAHEANHLKLDCSKARQTLGWRPKLPLDAALGWIVEWHRAHAAGADMRAVTLEQISRYQRLS